MTPSAFVHRLSRYRLDQVFNPYSDRCRIHDRYDAARRRRTNVKNVLESAIQKNVDTMWIARDLGYRGGRRTGLPLTDEVHLPVFCGIYGGLSLQKATKGLPVAERTAHITWQLLQRVNQPVFLWNIFPFHPFESGKPFSNRCHTKKERELCQPILFDLLEMLNPKKIIAIGRDSQIALNGFGLECEKIRHPSYGGQSEFATGIEKVYGLKPE